MKQWKLVLFRIKLHQTKTKQKTLHTGDGGDPEGEGAGRAGGEDGEEGTQEALHEVGV